MKKCYDCAHVEMCGWRKEVKEQGCEFFDDGMVWIPCSERLPISPKFCLVTTDGSNGDVIDIALYMSDGWHKASEVLAWMPLPEQYREEKQDE